MRRSSSLCNHIGIDGLNALFRSHICMKILTETADLLIVEDETSKAAFKAYVILMIIINILIIMYVKINLDIIPIWLFLLLIILDVVMIPARNKIKAVVNRKSNSLRLFENNKEQYASDYPLTEIKCIRRVLTYDYPFLMTIYNRTSLFAVLKNNHHKILISSKPLGVFYIDVEANKQARIGRKVAEFLRVPFQE